MESAVNPDPPRPTIEQLLASFGEEELSIQALFKFCYVPAGRLSFLKDLAVPEEWGARDFALLKYLAVHMHLAIAQGAFVWNGDQLVMAAGQLTTAQGAPIYLGISPNTQPEGNPWVVNWVGERPSTPRLPAPPIIGPWPQLDTGAEIIVACEFEHPERRVHLPGLDDAPIVARMSAVAGAITWALKRGQAARQIHSAGHGWFAPVYLNSREDLLATPDFVAPLLVQHSEEGPRYIVRSVLSAHNAYAPARAMVERCEQLPGWLLSSWEEAAEDASESEA